MKYLLYVDYIAGGEKPYAYIPLKARDLGEAIIESDAQYNPKDVYLVRIMVKDGSVEHPERGVSAQRYTSRYEKRSYRWYAYDETEHYVIQFKTKNVEWFE